MGQTRSGGGSNRLLSSSLVSRLSFCGEEDPLAGLLCALEGGVQSGPLGKGGLPEGMQQHLQVAGYRLDTFLFFS